MTQRLDIKSARYDKLGRSVQINGRGVIVEVSHEALETFSKKELTSAEAVYVVVNNARTLAKLAGHVPADDGKIHITVGILMNDGLFEQ